MVHHERTHVSAVLALDAASALPALAASGAAAPAMRASLAASPRGVSEGRLGVVGSPFIWQRSRKPSVKTWSRNYT